MSLVKDLRRVNTLLEAAGHQNRWESQMPRCRSRTHKQEQGAGVGLGDDVDHVSDGSGHWSPVMELKCNPHCEVLKPWKSRAGG